jgi:hypothetical protein
MDINSPFSTGILSFKRTSLAQDAIMDPTSAGYILPTDESWMEIVIFRG